MKKLTFALLLAGCAHGPRFVAGPDGRPPAPIIVDPKPNAVIVDARPPVTLDIPPGTEVAHVELCRDPKCESVLTSFDAQGTRATPAADVQTGVYYVRASAKAGGRHSLTGPIQKLVVERRTLIEGKRFTIEGPLEGRATLERFEPLAAKVVDFICDYLALPTPSDNIRISLYGTKEGYHVATDRLTEGRATGNSGGFAERGSLYLKWQGPLARAVVEGPGALEFALAHELAHVVQANALPRYHRQPTWVTEGVANLLGALSLAAIYGVSPERVATMRDVHTPARRALDEGHLIPVAKFLDADSDLFRTKVHATQALFYSEAYALLRALGDPANRLRDFLRELDNRDADATELMRSRFRRVFGEPNQLDQQLKAWLLANEPGWTSSDVDLRALPDERVFFDVGPGGAGVAIGRRIPESGVVDLDFEPTAETQFFTLRLGPPGDGQRYVVVCASDGRLQTEQRIGPRINRLAGDKQTPLDLTRPHHLQVRYDAHQIEARLDDRPAVVAQLPVAPSGRAGVGVTGRGTLLGLKIGPLATASH